MTQNQIDLLIALSEKIELIVRDKEPFHSAELAVLRQNVQREIQIERQIRLRLDNR